MRLAQAVDSARQHLDDFPLGVVCASATGRTVYANRCIRSMVGPVPPGLPGERWAAAFGLARGDGDPYRRVGEIPLLRALEEGDVSAPMTSRDGTSTVVLASNTTPVLSATGDCLGSVGLFRPVTRRTVRTSPVDPPATAWQGPETEAEALLLLAALHHIQSESRNADVSTAERAVRLITHRHGEPWTLDSLSRELFVTPGHLTSEVSMATGRGAMRLLAEMRIRHAQRLLSDTALPITAVGAAVGLPDSDRFARTFQRVAGSTPTEFRRSASRRKRGTT